MLAQEEARNLNHHFIGTEHLLLGLLRLGEGPAFEALSEFGITLDSVRREIEELHGSETPAHSLPFTPRAKKILEHARDESIKLGDGYIGTGHLLLGVIVESGPYQILERNLVSTDQLRQRVIELAADPTNREAGSSMHGRVAAARERLNRSPFSRSGYGMSRRIVEVVLRRLVNRSRRILGIRPPESGAHHPYVWGFGSHHRAHCDCGWDGQRRKSDEEAISDTIEHMRNNEAEGSNPSVT